MKCSFFVTFLCLIFLRNKNTASAPKPRAQKTAVTPIIASMLVDSPGLVDEAVEIAVLVATLDGSALPPVCPDMTARGIAEEGGGLIRTEIFR